MKHALMWTSVGAIVLAAFIVATISPASALPAPPSLPVRDSLFAIGTSATSGSPLSQLVSVDSSTAVVTPIGTGRVDATYNQFQSAWDPQTNTAYFLENTDGGTTLGKMNVTNGVSTLAATQTISGDLMSLRAIAINKAGEAFAIAGTSLWSLNLQTSLLEPIADINANISGLAFDPTTDVLYGVTYDGNLYTISTSGVLTLVAVLTLSQFYEPGSLQVDSNGILWITEMTQAPTYPLWSVDPHNSYSEALSGTLTDTVDSSSFATQSLLLIPGQPITAPAITSTDKFITAAGTAFAFSVTATGTPAPTFVVSAGALPTGISLNPVTGVLSGTATTGGTFVFTISAVNGGNPAYQEFTLTVNALPLVGG